MNVLGISCYYHDASATLIHNGEIVAAAEEERFTRNKHDNRFPELAIDFCLKQGNITAKDVDLVCFYEKPLRKLERVLACGKRWSNKSDVLLKQQLSQLMHEHLFIETVLKDKIGYSGKVVYTDHHLAHAASSYYISGFNNAAILTVDGVGEWATTAMFSAEGTTIKKIQEIHYPDSIGLLYSAFTAFLGFKVNNDEYKVMGLASYGNPKHIDDIKKLITFYKDGSFRLNLDYFSFMHDNKRMYTDKFIDLFGEPRLAESTITEYHMDLAASLQKVLEEGMIQLGNELYRKTKLDNVCLAGGVTLNCVANTSFIENTPFKNISIQPAAGDAGGSMGAALYAYYHSGSGALARSKKHSTLLGPEYSGQEIKQYLDRVGAMYTEFDSDGICRKAAELIHKDKIIGWFQGRMEFGPRALGCRSILANPCNPAMKDILNSRVKFREDFRPFAPAILSEKRNDYFTLTFDSPYMLFISGVREGMAGRIPSVTHIDNTARLQTVPESDNPAFYKLINEFSHLSGIPVVINTSFNVRGEPIVCTPEDAYNCFLKTDIDFLIMGNYLVEKEI